MEFMPICTVYIQANSKFMAKSTLKTKKIAKAYKNA